MGDENLLVNLYIDHKTVNRSYSLQSEGHVESVNVAMVQNSFN